MNSFGKEPSVSNERVFHHLTKSRNQLARRQRHERFRVDKNCRRLMKRTNKVLAHRQSDSRFSADRSIDLSEQCGGNLDDRNTAQLAGRRKSGQVANHAATQRDNQPGSLEAAFSEKLNG